MDGKKLEMVGSLLYGDGWAPQMAKDMGLSARHLRMLATGQRRVTKAFLVQLEHICFRRIERLEVWHKIVISELREDGGSSIA